MEEPDLCLLEYFTTKHTKSKGYTWLTLSNSLITIVPSCFSHVLCFLNVPFIAILYIATRSLRPSLCVHCWSMPKWACKT